MNIYEYIRNTPGHHRLPKSWEELQGWVDLPDRLIESSLVAEAQALAEKVCAENTQLLEAIDKCAFDGRGVFAAKQLAEAIRARGETE